MSIEIKYLIEYLNSGVKIGWLINPNKQQVNIYKIDREVVIINRPDILSGESILSNLTVDLAEIFQ